ncbi:putative integral membrane protein [Acanthocheilonema viteae]
MSTTAATNLQSELLQCLQHLMHILKVCIIVVHAILVEHVLLHLTTATSIPSTIAATISYHLFVYRNALMTDQHRVRYIPNFIMTSERNGMSASMFEVSK